MARGAYLLRAEEENDARFDILCFNPNVCDMTGVAADIIVYMVPAEMELLGWYITVLTLVDSDTGDPVLSIDVADFDATTNRTEIANQAIVDTTAAGTEYLLEFTAPTLIRAGQTLILEHKTQATSAGAVEGDAHVQAFVRFTGRG